MLETLIALAVIATVASIVHELRAADEEFTADELEAAAAAMQGERTPESREVHGISGTTLASTRMPGLPGTAG